MKVKLLNHGGFAEELATVLFPVEVEAEYHELGHGAVRVPSHELYRVGAECGFIPGKSYTFFAEEIEVLDE